MGRFLQGKGRVVVTSGDLAVANHREKVDAFHGTLRSLYPEIKCFPAIQNHESETEAYERMREFLSRNQHLDGLYVSTGNGAPVLRAVKDAGLFGKVQIIATSLYPALVPAISQGQVAASIYERPYSQGRIAFRILHDFLVEGRCPTARVTLAPLLIMKSNLNRFLEQEYIGTENGRGAASDDAEALAVSGSVRTSFEYV
jgi:LacI family transcriptional regulator